MTREIDKEIAEKVFGLKDVVASCPDCKKPVLYSGVVGKKMRMKCKDCDWAISPTDAIIPRYYSEMTSAAWDVVEKMQEKGHTYLLISRDNDAHAAFYYRGNKECGHSVDQASAPLAICMAALDAVKKEDK